MRHAKGWRVISMNFCTNCGARFDAGSTFCKGCGVRISARIANEPGVTQAAPPQAVDAGPKKSSGLGKVVLSLAAVFLLFVGLGIAGLVYAGHKAKEKIAGITATGPASRSEDSSTRENAGDEKKNNNSGNKDEKAASILNGIGGLMDRMGFGDPLPNPYSDLPVVKSSDVHKNRCSGADTAKDAPAPSMNDLGPSGIPMRKGLVIVHAWGRKPGDSESINSVTQLTDRFAEISDSWTYFQSAEDVKGTPGADLRDVCTEDLQTAHGLMTGFGNDDPRTEPGTTTVDVSKEVFNDLKTRGKTEFHYLEWIKTDLADADGYLHWEGGELVRVENNDVSLPVIVNGTPTTLLAIHAAGTLVVEDKKARETSKSPTDSPTPTEIYILDDPRNPLLLLYEMDVNNFRVQVTEIKFPVDKPVTKIEDELLKNKKAVVYGIYFDYNSDQIKKESEPVLREIAAAMKNNPDWKLTVDGHTDSIGGDTYNLDLSKRRAAAVKLALVNRFQISADRLLTEGFGQRRPVDRNDTLEGRARNRRVELTRE
jgi:outer membrane protein OmpA-like peptidoglycan-associated protein